MHKNSQPQTQVGKGQSRINGTVKVMLTDENGKIKYEKTHHNDLTSWAKFILKHYALYTSNGQVNVSPLKNSIAFSGATRPYIDFWENIGENTVNLLGDVKNGLSLHGEERNWSPEEIIGTAFNTALQEPKQGAILAGSCEMTANRIKLVLNFPGGIATGKIHHVVRGNVTGEMSGRKSNHHPAFYYPNSRRHSGNAVVGNRNGSTKAEIFGNGSTFYPPYINNDTGIFYSLLPLVSPVENFVIKRNLYVKDEPGELPYFKLLDDFVIPVPVSGMAANAIEMLFCSDDFVVFKFQSPLTPHVLGKFDFNTRQWSFPNPDSGRRDMLTRGYEYTQSTENEDSVDFNALTVCSVDGKYIYSFQNYVRNQADTSPVWGKAKIDTDTWEVVDRRDASFNNPGISWGSPYTQSILKPGKLSFMSNSASVNLQTFGQIFFGWALNTHPLSTRTWMYLDGFDPEEHFVNGTFMQGQAQEIFDKYAVIAPDEGDGLFGLTTVITPETNPMYHPIPLKDGSEMLYSPFVFLPMSKFYDNPWKACQLTYNVFSQYTLLEPIEKLLGDSLRVEYEFEVDEPLWEVD